ncbi:galactosyl transferase GMA12/MNN10 family-domain-containing protein [Aspergillus cavernicola]|uniref:Galactosyl transferase GMA12/MNN10 family-domain-containing protein n=1 Tax=Aspergillus cavernicola TaxID=176166 RepID=A0ABR4HPN7_9EURO
MSLTRSPSPRPEGGWSSPGLTPGSGSSTPRGGLYPTSPSDPWLAAKAKSDEVRGYPSFSTRNNGFFSRSKRQIKATLPRFRASARSPKGYSEKDGFPHGHGRGWRSLWFGRTVLRRRRARLFLALILLVLGYLCFSTLLVQLFRRSGFGGGRKFVIILESNVEGGVMEWKGAREWAIERNSISDKTDYAKTWGYELEVVNMLAKKRYSHEWREGWEKVDILRETMRKYPDAEWFWWLDLTTYVMEHSYSLQDHIFNRLDEIVYRDINEYNPLNITHPLIQPYLDEVSRSADGDKDPSSIHFLLSQDCGGFNLGSFFIHRSLWSERLLDIWWDPIMYEQRHMQWEHKEQDALEYLYTTQPWVRSSLAFVPQRYINSFPPGACGDELDPKIHYTVGGRDFLVNMAGCDYGRDCWDEMYQYREYSKWLNRTIWGRLHDSILDLYYALIGEDKRPQAEAEAD